MTFWDGRKCDSPCHDTDGHRVTRAACGNLVFAVISPDGLLDRSSIRYELFTSLGVVSNHFPPLVSSGRIFTLALHGA